MRSRVALLTLSWILSLISEEVRAQTQWMTVTQFSTFTFSTNSEGRVVTMESPILRSEKAWTELLLSWNVAAPAGTGLEFWAEALYPEGPTPRYCLGLWSADTNQFPRQSVQGQKDAQGEVATDILRLARPTTSMRLRVILRRAGLQPFPNLRYLSCSLSDSTPSVEARPANRAAWGARIDVPQSSQHAYEGGRAWCSPTCVSMVLNYWASQRDRKDLAVSVPQVAAGVFDTVWKGTGNWSFNMAYAGSFDAVTAYAVRLRDLREVENEILHSVPVVVSVSRGLLRGKASREPDDGHLVLICGFSETGDVWVNDPDAPYPPVPGKSVRRLYPRADVERAWARSQHTAYIITAE